MEQWYGEIAGRLQVIGSDLESHSSSLGRPRAGSSVKTGRSRTGGYTLRPMSDDESGDRRERGALADRLSAFLRTDEPLVGPARPRYPLARTLSLAVLIGILAGAVSTFIPHPITLGGVGVGDIGPPVVSGKLYLDGRSPYQVSLKGVEITLYPFTTSLALSPLLLLSPQWWAPVFVVIVSAALAFAILTRGEIWRLLVFLSLPFWSAIHSVQWSPLFTAALLLPALLPVAIVKPQLGVVLAVSGRWRRRDVIVAATFFLLSVVLLPTWPMQWLRQGRLDQYEGRIPLLIGVGIVGVTCVYLWRNGRARLLLVMSIISQRYYYDQLLLFLIPRGPVQMAVLVATSWTGAAICWFAGWWVPASGVQDARVWQMTTASIFLPCLVMVWMEWWKARREGDEG